MKYLISTWNSISSVALDDMINQFLRTNYVDIVCISHSSTYDSTEKNIEYSTSILFKYQEGHELPIQESHLSKTMV